MNRIKQSRAPFKEAVDRKGDRGRKGEERARAPEFGHLSLYEKRKGGRKEAAPGVASNTV